MTRLLELGLVETVDKKNITSGSPSGKSYSLSLSVSLPLFLTPWGGGVVV